MKGIASVGARTASSVSGRTRCRLILGSLVPAHGEATTCRSRTAASEMPVDVRRGGPIHLGRWPLLCVLMDRQPARIPDAVPSEDRRDR